MIANKLEVHFPEYGIIYSVAGGQITAFVPQHLEGSPLVNEILDFLKEQAVREPAKLDEIQRLEAWDRLQQWFEQWRGNQNTEFFDL